MTTGWAGSPIMTLARLEARREAARRGAPALPPAPRRPKRPARWTAPWPRAPSRRSTRYRPMWVRTVGRVAEAESAGGAWPAGGRVGASGGGRLTDMAQWYSRSAAAARIGQVVGRLELARPGSVGPQGSKCTTTQAGVFRPASRRSKKWWRNDVAAGFSLRLAGAGGPAPTPTPRP